MGGTVVCNSNNEKELATRTGASCAEDLSIDDRQAARTPTEALDELVAEAQELRMGYD